MTEDARFEDAPLSDRPLKLRAETAEDLTVLSALCQDAVGRVADITWLPRKRRLIVLMNRFRWEDEEDARAAKRPFERVRAALSLDSVLAVKARRVDPSDRERIFDILALVFQPGEDGDGTVHIQLAGDGQLSVRVECLDASLADLTRPWASKLTKAPEHEG